MTEKSTTSNVVPLKGKIPVQVLSADETYANTVHLRIMDLMKKYEETYFELARYLYEVKFRRLYRVIGDGYETYQDYVELAIGIDLRKAKYLARLWWWFGIEQKGNPKLLQGAQEIGWSKSKELIEVVDGRNASKWFRLARELNTVDLGRAARVAKKNMEAKPRQPNPKHTTEEEARAIVQEMAQQIMDGAQNPIFAPGDSDLAASGVTVEVDVVDGGAKAKEKLPDLAPGKLSDKQRRMKRQGIESDDSSYPQEVGDVTRGVDPPKGLLDEVKQQRKEAEKWHLMRFKVHDDNKKIIDDALKFAGKLAESTHQGHLLSLICLHYCSFYDKQRGIVVGEWLAALERLTGLSLVALDRRNDEIVYGAELIEALAKEGDDECEPGVGDSGDEGGDIAP
jgi:hypothetical protein